MKTKTKTLYEDIENLIRAKTEGILQVGDELITTDIDGRAVFVVAHITSSKIRFIRKYILMQEKPMKSDDFNLLVWLGDTYARSLPEDIQRRIWKNVTLPTEKQVFGVNEIGKPEERKQWKYFRNTKHKIATLGIADEHSRWWWLRTPYYDESRGVVSSTYFAFVSSGGRASNFNASYSHGVRPAFTIRA